MKPILSTNPGDADYSSVEHRKPKVPEVVAIMVSHFMLEFPARAGVNVMGTAARSASRLLRPMVPCTPAGSGARPKTAERLCMANSEC